MSLLSSPSPPLPKNIKHHHFLRAASTPLPSSSSSTSVAVVPDQATLLLTSVRKFPPSPLPQQAQSNAAAAAAAVKTSLVNEEENMLQKILVRNRQHAEEAAAVPLHKEKEKQEFDRYLKYFERRLLYQPGLWHLFPTSFTEETLPNLVTESKSLVASETNIGSELLRKDRSPSSVKPEDVLALAKKAMIASKNAALLADKSDILAAEFDQVHLSGLDLHGFNNEILIEEKPAVRSKRRLERLSKKRKVSRKPDDDIFEVSTAATTDVSKKIKKGLNNDDPLRLFLSGLETKQLLTVKEEKVLFSRIQEHRKLEDVKQRLQMQFNREPTLSEWAEAVGMSRQDLYSSISSGKRCREKMIYANFRLVIHIAKQYEGKGLNIQDLLQEGSKGLMKSLEKFKPKAGCRFPTYAYWWIRQSIRKAIFQNSRTIRLPENVFALLKKIQTARRLCRQEGHTPTSEELAKRVGIRVERLQSVLMTSRNPLSIQERAWADQDVTFQEITADPEVEIPDLIIAKQMMRQHVGNLLGLLNRRERQIIKFRFGIGSERMSLSEIGAMYSLSKERVRQLESRAMDKLKECLPSQGLEAYIDLLTT